MEIITKQHDDGSTLYSVRPPVGIRIYPIGYFKTEQQAIDAYNNALNGNNQTETTS